MEWHEIVFGIIAFFAVAYIAIFVIGICIAALKSLWKGIKELIEDS